MKQLRMQSNQRRLKSFFLCIICITFLLLFIAPGMVFADDGIFDDQESADSIIDRQLNAIGAEEIERFWREVKEEYGGFLPENQPLTLRDFFQMDSSTFISGIMQGMLKFLFHEIVLNAKLLASIIMLTIFSMILRNIQAAFEHNNVSKVAYAITFLVIMLLAVNSFYSVMNYAKEAISAMVNLMMALIPLILALMATMGNFSSVTFFHPIIIFLIHISGTLIYSVVLPLLFFSAVLGIISTMSEEYKVTQLANLLRNVSVGLLIAFLTMFLGVISAQGATSAVVDGVTIKAAKFVTGNFIPVVGKMFTDAAETVMGASLVVKNTLGLAGVIILVIICLFPALKILVIGFIFHLSAALLQPLGNSSIISCLNIIGKNILFVFAALITVCLMFFLGLAIIIGASNISYMVR